MMLGDGWGILWLSPPFRWLWLMYMLKKIKMNKGFSWNTSPDSSQLSFSWCEAFSSMNSLHLSLIFFIFYFPLFFSPLVAHSFISLCVSPPVCSFLSSSLPSYPAVQNYLALMLQPVLAKVSSSSRPKYALDLMMGSHLIPNVPGLEGKTEKGWGREDGRKARRIVPWKVPGLFPHIYWQPREDDEVWPRAGGNRAENTAQCLKSSRETGWVCMLWTCGM